MQNSWTSPNANEPQEVVVRTSSAPPIVSPVRRGTTPEPNQAPFSSDAGIADVQLQSLIRSLDDACRSFDDLPPLLNCFAQIASRESECLAMWVGVKQQTVSEATAPLSSPALTPTNAFPFSKFHPLTDDNANALWETISDAGLRVAAAAIEAGRIASTPLPFPTATHLVAAPIYCVANDGSAKNSSVAATDESGAAKMPTPGTEAPPPNYLLLGCFSESGATVLRLQWLMGILSQALSLWLSQRSTQQVTHKQTQLAEALKLVRDLSATTTRTEAALLVVNHMRRFSRVGCVAITIEGHLLALSDVEQVDARNENNSLTELACNQAYRMGAAIRYPIRSEDESADSASMQTILAAFCRASHTQACVGFPLKKADGNSFGGLLFAGSLELLEDEQRLKHWGEMSAMIAGELDVVLRANRGLRDITKAKLGSVARHSWTKLALIAVALIVGILAIPMPYRIGCDCEIQPVLRRFVAAPYEGLLKSSMVKNGQIVSKNELLATLDGRQLRYELSGLEAELAGAKKRRDLALATGDIAQSQIARSEMERYQSKIEMLNRRTENLEVRSPIAGIIVSGDLENVQGAPLEMGQTLFEVAPLDKMVSEIAIPESEISYVTVGMPVVVKLSAFPFETFEGSITRIHPKTEIVNDNSVFMAEVSLSSDRVELRPGMKGSAKIRSHWSPLAWNLFHRPWEAVRCWMIW